MRTLAIEEWRDIPGYEGKYQASSLGRIKSLDREITQIGRWGNSFTRTIKGRVLKPGRYNKDNHVSVVLGHGANGSMVHYLVAITFIGKRPANEDIRHKDGNPLNNKVNNLEYGTRTENILDVYRQGKKWRTTSIEQALQIKELLQEDTLKCTYIARIVGVKANVVYAIKGNKSFWWLDERGGINA